MWRPPSRSEPPGGPKPPSRSEPLRLICGLHRGWRQAAGAFGRSQQPQAPPQQPPPPPDCGADGAVPPRPVTATVDRSLTVSVWPWGHDAGCEDAAIGRLISKVSPQARQRKSYRGIYTAYGLGVTLRRPGPSGCVACGYRTRSMGLAGGRRPVVSSGWRMGRRHPRSGAGYVPRRLIMMGRWVVPVLRPTILVLVRRLPLGDPPAALKKRLRLLRATPSPR